MKKTKINRIAKKPKRGKVRLFHLCTKFERKTNEKRVASLKKARKGTKLTSDGNTTASIATYQKGYRFKKDRKWAKLHLLQKVLYNYQLAK